MLRAFLPTFLVFEALFLGGFTLLFGMAVFLSPVEGAGLKPSDLPFLFAGVTYLTFIFTWAMAYTSLYRFPRNQRVLLLGSAIGALGAGGLGLFEAGGFSLEGLRGINLANVMVFYLFGCVAAAMQLYFLTIAFWVFSFIRRKKD